MYVSIHCYFLFGDLSCVTLMNVRILVENVHAASCGGWGLLFLFVRFRFYEYSIACLGMGFLLVF